MYMLKTRRMVISFNQQKRINKVYTDPIFLIDKHDNIENNTITFKICGSTKLMYDIVLTSNGSFHCSCPDMFSTSSHHVCKHICFVIIKVLKHASFINFALNNHRLDAIAVNLAREVCASHCDVYNEHLAKQYHNLVSADFNCKAPKTEEDECPICYSALNDSDMSKLKSCPCCKNVVHTLCIEKWLTMATQPTCVYCRSDVWKQYSKLTRPGLYIKLQ